MAIIVFYPEPNSELQTIQVPGSTTCREISEMVGGVNWYGSSKSTPQEAIAEAVQSGFRYRPPEYMEAMTKKIEQYRTILTEFNLE